MGPKDIDVISKEVVFRGYFRIDRFHLRHEQFAGGMGQEIQREIFERGHAAHCLPYDPDLDKLVFIEQFRTGAYAALKSPWFDESEASPWLTELVAGIIEEGETPEELIRREAMEESGCEVHDLEFIAKYLVTPGGSSETAFMYCGKVDASNASGIHGLDHEGEDIRVFSVDVEDAFEMLDAGKFNNSAILIAMLWFRLNHTKLKEKWSSLR